MNGELTVQEVKALFIGGLDTNFQDGIALKLDGLITFDTHQMMVVMGIGLIDFIMLVPLRQF